MLRIMRKREGCLLISSTTQTVQISSLVGTRVCLISGVGVLWAAKVVKMGYRWKIRNRKIIRFWEDVWLGSSSLAIQYWEIYCIVNEQNRSIDPLWGGVNLKCTFRRCVDNRLFNMWEEIMEMV
jgi:hypothetical protein